MIWICALNALRAKLLFVRELEYARELSGSPRFNIDRGESMHKRFASHTAVALSLGLAATPAAATIIKFDAPNATETYAGSININDVIAGAFYDTSGSHGFVRTPDGTITAYDPPGSVLTDTGAINDDGTIVGTWLDNSYAQHGYLRAADGSYRSFDAPDAEGTFGNALNNRGVVR
jgi:hypothetical protein